MLTMRQLAKLAGVSPSTVSRALGDYPHVSPAIRERIQALAKEYGYHPSHESRPPASGRSGLLGCIIHRNAGPLYNRILHGILEQAYTDDFTLLVLQTPQTAEGFRTAVASLLEHRVEGIIFSAMFTESLPNEVFMEICSAGAIPVATMRDILPLSVDLIKTDEERLAFLAVKHLWELGHREIGFIGQVSQAGHERLSFIQRAFAYYGLPQTYCLATPPPTIDSLTEVIMSWMRKPTRPTAIITMDNFAGAGLFHLMSCGMRIPQDISLLGIGNYLQDIFIPILSAIDQRPEEIGRQAVVTIRTRLAENQLPGEYQPETRLIAPTLIERATCGPAPHHVKSF